jgi:prepilin-type N-terminal cleavage/methylation domain-containing protein
MKPRFSNQTNHALTLTEVLVVIVVLAVLAMILMPIWSGCQRKGYSN